MRPSFSISLRSAFVLFLCLNFCAVKSQTSDQARTFVNRTHIAIAKVEKEMYKLGKNEHDAEVKQAMKFQTIAIKKHAEGDAVKAVAYSYRARKISLDLLNTLAKNSVEALSLSDEERTYTKPLDASLNTSTIDKSIEQKIDAVNIIDPLKFREIELNIK